MVLFVILFLPGSIHTFPSRNFVLNSSPGGQLNFDNFLETGYLPSFYHFSHGCCCCFQSRDPIRPNICIIFAHLSAMVCILLPHQGVLNPANCLVLLFCSSASFKMLLSCSLSCSSVLSNNRCITL